jgi:hypothetical protein
MRAPVIQADKVLQRAIIVNVGSLIPLTMHANYHLGVALARRKKKPLPLIRFFETLLSHRGFGITILLFCIVVWSWNNPERHALVHLPN